MKKAVIKGLVACKSRSGFVALEKDVNSKCYWVVNYSNKGEKLSLLDIPLSNSRKMIVSNDDQMAVILLQDGLAAISLVSGEYRIWSFPDAERILATNSGVIVQSDRGETSMITPDLDLKPQSPRPELVAIRSDFSVSLEKRDGRYMSLFSSCRFDTAHSVVGNGVLDVHWSDDCLWVAESAASLRAFDTERGNLMFEVWPNRGWHYDLLAPTQAPHEIVATVTNFENGSELQIFSLNWKDGHLTKSSKVHLPIAPLHRAFIDWGLSLVSGTREIYDCENGAIISEF